MRFKKTNTPKKFFCKNSKLKFSFDHKRAEYLNILFPAIRNDSGYCFTKYICRFQMHRKPIINFNPYRDIELPYIINVEFSCLYPYIYLVKIDFEIGTTQNVFLVWHQTWFSCWLRYWDAFLDLSICISYALFAHKMIIKCLII